MKHTVILLMLLICCSCSRQLPEPVVIDLSKRGEPISEYVYGQFIEHLGRCIYGGIWAEMLEDRKFYHPITDDFNPWGTDSDPFWNTGEYTYLKASPWQVTGPRGTVTMDKKEPFTGDHSPMIRLPGDGTVAGIRQEGLMLVEGRSYTGRIVLSGSPDLDSVFVRLVNKDTVLAMLGFKDIPGAYTTFPFEFVASASAEQVAIEILGRGKGSFRIGTLSLMPSDNISGWRSDVIEILKELNAPVYRWPGGNFVSGYNWRDGIGDRDKRPPRKNPAWKGVEPNDVGIHEYMELMEILDAEPYVTVNTGLGTVQEVAEEVEYFNGPADSPDGKLRAANGHPEPYHVKWWAIGNEMYGQWQLGHMPLADYVLKHNDVAEAIWKVDPDAKLIAVGALGEWSRTMLTVCPGYMNLLSEHLYCRELKDVTAHTGQIADVIRNIASTHRMYRDSIPGLREKDIRIALDEWNYWYGDYIYGELGVQYHHKDALGVARGLHELFRNSDLFFMANYAQTVNVIGCIKTTPVSAGFDATGLPLKLYRNHFGTIPLEITGQPGNLDISAALTSGEEAVTIAVVNASATDTVICFDFPDAEVSREVTEWIIQNPDPEAINEPGKTPGITIGESKTKLRNNCVRIPLYSIVMVRWELK